METVLIFLILMLFVVFFATRLRLRIINFNNERYIIPFKDRHCPIMHFASKGNYRRDKNGNWFSENRFNLSEWTWADKFNMRFFVNRFAQLYLKIFSGRLYAVVVFVYLCVVYSLTFLDDKLEKNLNLFLIFWLGLLLSIIFKELIFWKRLAN